MSINQITRTIPQGATHKATAEAIYTYLRDNPADLPNDMAARTGDAPYRLIVRVEGTDAALRIGELTGTWYDVFPDNVPWSEDVLSRGTMFTKDALASDKPEERAHVTSYIRTSLMRSLRYATKRTARLAEIAQRDADEATA